MLTKFRELSGACKHGLTAVVAMLQLIGIVFLHALEGEESDSW